MAMFAEKEERSFLEQFQKDFKRLYTISPEKQLDETISLTRKFSKTIIGRTHEYTVEEALFILKEEEIISNDHYVKFEEMLLMLSFFRYSGDETQITLAFLKDLEQLCVNIVQDLMRKKTTSDFVEDYAKNELKLKSSSDEGVNTFLQHKRDIMQTEKKIVEKILSAQSNSGETVTPSHENPLSDTLKLKTSFYDFFLNVVGHEPSYITDLLAQEHIAKDIVWDLYTKYYLLGGVDPKEKLITYVTHEDDITAIEKALINNEHYCDISSYSYLGEMKAVLLLLIILVLNKKDLRVELPKLYDSFSKDTIYFVLQNVFPTGDTKSETSLSIEKVV